jgi:hypothetical protein
VEWSTEEVCLWLERPEVGLSAYQNNFKKAGVNGNQLFTMPSRQLDRLLNIPNIRYLIQLDVFDLTAISAILRSWNSAFIKYWFGCKYADFMQLKQEEEDRKNENERLKHEEVVRIKLNETITQKVCIINACDNFEQPNTVEVPQPMEVDVIVSPRENEDATRAQGSQSSVENAQCDKWSTVDVAKWMETVGMQEYAR